ncbi:MAG: shikimate kinase [Bacteroidota bacterium]
MIIWLVGLMGSGKSTVGKQLAQKIGFAWHDTDKLIEVLEGQKIHEIFSKKGEDYFRSKEEELFEKISSMSDVVISTGGGFPCHHDLMGKMISTGQCIYLDYPSEVLSGRLISDPASRPLLSGMSNVDEITLFLNRLLSEREGIYSESQWILRNDPEPANTIHRILFSK